MSITFRCSRCLDEIRVPEGTAGKKTRCPHCQAVQEIPAPSQAPVSAEESPYESATSREVSAPQAYAADPANPFASPLATASQVGAPMSDQVRSVKRQKLLAPAIAQLVLVGLGFLWCLAIGVVGVSLMLDPDEREAGMIVAILQFAWALPQIPALIGLAAAVRFRSVGWAWAGFIIPLFSFPLGVPFSNCCCFLFVFPIIVSIWGLVCLNDPQVRSLFPTTEA